MSQMRIDATNADDVFRLAAAIVTTPLEKRPAVLAAAHHFGLMRARGLVLRLSLYLAKRRHGRAGLALMFREWQKRDPDAVYAMIVQTGRHVLKGRDAEDARSAGGWSQREVDLFQGAVRFASLEERANG